MNLLRSERRRAESGPPLICNELYRKKTPRAALLQGEQIVSVQQQNGPPDRCIMDGKERLLDRRLYCDALVWALT